MHLIRISINILLLILSLYAIHRNKKEVIFENEYVRTIIMGLLVLGIPVEIFITIISFTS